MPEEHSMKVFYELFERIPRQGPGDAEATRKAFAMIPPLTPKPQILDIGCGTGTQTLDLAGLTDGIITAIDNHQGFLDILAKNAAQAGLTERIRPLNRSMMEPGFDEAQFDLIWSEGAIFIIGFEKGLRTWRPLLKDGGCLVVSEATWPQPDPPEEVRALFEADGNVINDTATNLKIAENAGYEVLDSFVLPQQAWVEFYGFVTAEIEKMRGEYAGNEEADAVFAMFQHEIDLYHRFPDYYAYVFYVLRKK